MTQARPAIPIRNASGKPSAEALAQMDKRWRWRYVMLAPPRLGFLLAMVVLVASGVWWALVQLDRATCTNAHHPPDATSTTMARKNPNRCGASIR